MTTTEIRSVQVGDIFYTSWGYDQTNVGYYEVVRCTSATVWLRQTVWVRQIASSWDDGYNRVAPIPGNFIGELEMHRLKNSGSRPAFYLTSCSNAWLWDGAPKYATDPWSGH